MTATEAQPATKTDDVIKAFMRDDDFRRLNHHVDAAVDGEDVRAVFSIDMTATNTSLRVLITETGDVIETDPTVTTVHTVRPTRRTSPDEEP